MSDRLQEIRARVDDSAPITLSGPPALVAAFEQKDADIAWLLAEVERLKHPKPYKMNVTMVKDGRTY